MLAAQSRAAERGQVLDISCGTGYPAIEILRRMREGSRLIAIDASSAMLRRGAPQGRGPRPARQEGRVLPHRERGAKVSFADDVYDLVVCNLGLTRCRARGRGARLRARLQQGGEVRCTLPLAGTFLEFHDIFARC